MTSLDIPRGYRLSTITLVLMTLLALTGCAQLKQQAETIKPTAKLADARLKSIDFEQVELVFDLAVENRNPVALDLSGLDYDFMIDGRSLVSGVTAEAIQLKANGTSMVALPVSLKYEDLKQLGSEVWSKDRLAYDLQTTFRIKLPVIGDYALPVSKQGEIPVPKVPKIKLKKVKLEEMGFTSASVIAMVEVSNPNDFMLALQKLRYDLAVNDTHWGSGKITEATSVASKSSGIIEIPLQLDLLSMGTAAMSLLQGSKALEYRLQGEATLDTGLELLKGVDMPLDIKGSTAMIK